MNDEQESRDTASPDSELTWQQIADAPDETPEHFTSRVQFARPSGLLDDYERQTLERRIQTLEDAVEAMVQAAYDCPKTASIAAIIHVGREALGK